MSITEFLIVWLSCLVTMLACRCIPIFVLKGRDLPERLREALNLIPPAAFAALVANDLFSPTMFSAGLWPGLIPLISAALVIVVARATKSLIWCAVTGFVVYALLSLL